MSRNITPLRNVNAKLGLATITTPGRHFVHTEFPALDGASIIDVNGIGCPDDIAKYLEGDTTITKFIIPSNVDKLCNYALASFPNVATIYITNYEEMVDLSASHVLDGLNASPLIYVPKNLLDDYETAYPSLSFTSWTQNHDLLISNNGNSELTLDYVNAIVNGLDVGDEAGITRTFVGSEFTTFEFGAMDFVFEGKVPNSTIELDNEILFLSSALYVSQNGVTLEVE